MAPLDASAADAFRRDLSAAQDHVASGISAARSNAADTHWRQWSRFCNQILVDPLLQAIDDPVLLLQVFAQRYRSGSLAPRGKPVRSRTVEDALRSIGQTFSGLGAADPRLIQHGKIDFRLSRQLASYSKEDPPPNRVKPVPLQVIRHILGVAYADRHAHRPGNEAIADMIGLAFFYLLRPGEYTAGPQTESTPFRFQDVQLFIGSQRINTTTATEATLRSATFGTLEFTTQKNGVRGEVIGLGRSGDPLLCPVQILIRRLLHLRAHHALPSAPLASYYNGDRPVPVRPSDITLALRQAVAIIGPAALGFNASDISARSMRAAGAMALLCAQVDSDYIRLLGRWRSDEMLRYLHVQAAPVMRTFSQRMLSHGHFTMPPNHEVPTL